jgi:hypothetical protein
MQNSQLLNVDVSGLKNLYQSSSSARMVLDSFAARQNDWGMTTVGSLHSYLTLSGFNISRKDIINTFTELQRLNCGEFKLGNRLGNRNYQTRIIWKVSLVLVGRIAKEQPI